MIEVQISKDMVEEALYAAAQGAEDLGWQNHVQQKLRF
jgi:hypothetical protein